jgi:prophage antirepressor-like protein
VSEALATLFEGKEVRVIEWEQELWLPIADIAKAWGIDRSTPDNMINRNMEVFGDVTRTVLDTASTPMQCINERGLYMLMGRISAGRLKNPAAKAAIIRFQKWFPELIQRYRKREIVQVQPAVNTLNTELDRARTIAELTGTDLKTMQAAALRKCGLKEYADALTPSLMHGEAGSWLNPTQIGNRCGHTAREVNNFLEWHRFQYRGPDGLWRLTDKGELHGEEYEFESTAKHIEIRIRWKPSILTASGLIREPAETLARA